MPKKGLGLVNRSARPLSALLYEPRQRFPKFRTLPTGFAQLPALGMQETPYRHGVWQAFSCSSGSFGEAKKVAARPLNRPRGGVKRRQTGELGLGRSVGGAA